MSAKFRLLLFFLTYILINQRLAPLANSAVIDCLRTGNRVLMIDHSRATSGLIRIGLPRSSGITGIQNQAKPGSSSTGRRPSAMVPIGGGAWRKASARGYTNARSKPARQQDGLAPEVLAGNREMVTGVGAGAG